MRSRLCPALLVLLLAGCLAAPASLAGGDEGEPAQITVQHLLIGYKRTVPNKKLDRSRREAKELAESLLARAEEGEDFDLLVKEFTDDKYPGFYLLVNNDEPMIPGGRKRKDMVQRFGDVAFGLKVGEVGLAAHHASMSPYGWHVIKRVE